MQQTPAFLDADRPPVPDLVTARGIVPFHLPGRPVRGRLVRLGVLADALLSRHANPQAVTRLTGEALALVAGLSSALTFRGSFSLQIKGDGPVAMLLADCTDQGALRGYARIEEARVEAGMVDLAPDSAPTARQLLGEGHFALTVDQGAGEDRHQGIVAITGDSLADMVRHYFSTSEQLRCEVRLACARTEQGWRAGMLILERIAREGGLDPALDETAQEESWRTALALAATLTDAELLDDQISPEHLLYRLFGNEEVAAERARALSFGCRCTRARLSALLEGFGADDLDHMSVGGDIVMNCEFCNIAFHFARSEVHGVSESEA